MEVLTPPQSHRLLCGKVLEADVNCLVEKPFTLTSNEADELMRLARAVNRKLFVIHNYSFVPAYVKAKEAVSRGAVGTVLNVDVFYSMPLSSEFLDPHHWTHAIPGDALGEIAPHPLYLLLEFVDNIERVSSIFTKRDTNKLIPHDEMKLLLEGKDAIGSVTVITGVGRDSRCAYIDVCGSRGVGQTRLATLS